jgi:predicted transcriptional regulator
MVVFVEFSFAMTVAVDKKKLSFYLEEEFKKDVERLARKRSRSISNLVEVLLRREVERAKENGEI